MRVPFNKLLLLIICLFLPLGILSCNSDNGNEAAESPAQKMTDAHIDSLIGKMTLQEKIGMIHGNGFFTSAGVKRLGIPEFHYTDGPFGIREEVHNDSWAPMGLTTDSATYMPTGSALAATWDTTMAHAYGVTLGQEARERGKDMLLGPAVNIERIPNGGRTFEFLTEDPFLNSELTVAYIKGVQSQDVASCVKHYVANNQETNRGTVNVEVSQRALHEIYMPAFKAAVEQAHVDGVMAAYNKVNGEYCSENPYLLTDVLRNDWGFKGMVISDWGGVHTTVAAAKAGLDVEMGSGSDFNKYYFA
ncbi:MAG TPA: glycoside hydrolase family 3 N-terminal domain-containing protein, partial [Balneolales bacterium]|nr:glycoside hydrolase family 3 N-terminal domain-containing protein [Balneolales bacterium]